MAKSFAWSYSKLKNLEVCPKRHYEVDIAKNYVDTSAQLDWGNSVHKSMAAALLHKAKLPASGTGRDRVEPAPLPSEMKDYQKWVHAYTQPSLPGQLYVEQKYAITRDFQPTGWFDGNVWYRGICDKLRVNKDLALAADWKTGKVLHDSIQLMLMSQCIFSHHPQVQIINTQFVWLKDDCVTDDTFTRATIAKEWPPVLERVKALEEAARTLSYPPRPNRMCARYCPVISCPHHGKRY